VETMDTIVNKVTKILVKLSNKRIFLASLSNLGLILVNLGILGTKEFNKLMTIGLLIANTLIYWGIFETEEAKNE
jgi:hypothetical protein